MNSYESAISKLPAGTYGGSHPRSRTEGQDVQPDREQAPPDTCVTGRRLSVGDAFGEYFFGSAARLIATRQLPPCPWRWTGDTSMPLSIVEVLLNHGRIDQGVLMHLFARRFAEEPWRGYAGGARHLPRHSIAGRRVAAFDTVPYCLWIVAHHAAEFEMALWTAVRGLGDPIDLCFVGGLVALMTSLPPVWLACREPCPRDLAYNC